MIYYDKEYDILAIHKGFMTDEKFKGNIDAGDFILDVSTKGRIRGIEVMNASSFFKEFKMEKKMLENITDSEFHAYIKPNGLFINILFKVKDIKQEIPAKIAVPLEIPA